MTGAEWGRCAAQRVHGSTDAALPADQDLHQRIPEASTVPSTTGRRPVQAWLTSAGCRQQHVQPQEGR